MKKIFRVIIAIISLACCVHADANVKIETQAYLKNAETGPELWVSAILINNSDQEQRVLIKPPETTLMRDAKGLVLQIGFTGRAEANGYALIPSISEYSPVGLREGEASRIMTKVDNNRTLETISEGEELRVKYVIHEAWAERFDLWYHPNETITEIKFF